VQFVEWDMKDKESNLCQ